MRAVEDAASAASTAAELAYNMTNKTVLDILYTYQVENFGDSCVWFGVNGKTDCFIFEEVIPLCLQRLNQSWEPFRLTWDYDKTFTGDSLITDDSVRDWIKDKMLNPARDLIQSLLNVKRIQGPLVQNDYGSYCDR